MPNTNNVYVFDGRPYCAGVEIDRCCKMGNIHTVGPNEALVISGLHGCLIVLFKFTTSDLICLF